MKAFLPFSLSNITPFSGDITPQIQYGGQCSPPPRDLGFNSVSTWASLLLDCRVWEPWKRWQGEQSSLWDQTRVLILRLPFSCYAARDTGYAIKFGFLSIHWPKKERELTLLRAYCMPALPNARYLYLILIKSCWEVSTSPCDDCVTKSMRLFQFPMCGNICQISRTRTWLHDPFSWRSCNYGTFSFSGSSATIQLLFFGGGQGADLAWTWWVKEILLKK